MLLNDKEAQETCPRSLHNDHTGIGITDSAAALHEFLALFHTSLLSLCIDWALSLPTRHSIQRSMEKEIVSGHALKSPSSSEKGRQKQNVLQHSKSLTSFFNIPQFKGLGTQPMKGISQTPIGCFVDWDRRMKVPVQVIKARNQGHQCGHNCPRWCHTTAAVSYLLQVT